MRDVDRICVFVRGKVSPLTAKLGNCSIMLAQRLVVSAIRTVVVVAFMYSLSSVNKIIAAP